MNDLSLTVEDAFFPVTIDGDLSSDYKIFSSTVPEIVEPVPLIDFSCIVVVIGTEAIPEVVLEGT